MCERSAVEKFPVVITVPPSAVTAWSMLDEEGPTTRTVGETDLPSESTWSGLKVVGQLSMASQTPSPAPSSAVPQTPSGPNRPGLSSAVLQIPSGPGAVSESHVDVFTQASRPASQVSAVHGLLSSQLGGVPARQCPEEKSQVSTPLQNRPSLHSASTKQRPWQVSPHRGSVRNGGEGQFRSVSSCPGFARNRQLSQASPTPSPVGNRNRSAFVSSLSP